jgi:hypothetical protein
MNRTASAIAMVAVLAACDDPADAPASGPVLGILQLEGWAEMATAGPDSTVRDTTVRWTYPPGENAVIPPEVLVVPPEVQAGQPFMVAVTTIGEGGCWSAESQEVRITDRTVELTPYDVHSGHAACTMILLHLSHESTVTLDEPGEWTIRVTGRRARHGDETWATPVSAEKVIVVH